MNHAYEANSGERRARVRIFAAVRLFRGVAFLLMLIVLASNSTAGGVPRAECFPIESLEPELRPKAEALLLKMLDSEALYTLVGGIKPVSSSFWWTRFKADDPDLSNVDQTRHLLSVMRCGESYHADVLVFAATHGGMKHVHAWVAHRPTLEKAVAAHAPFFARYGISPRSHPLEIVLTVEHAPTSDRLRGSGYLFGYPDHAVDFFVKADTDRSASTDKKLVPRDFYSVPTFAAATHKFVWAVPKGSQPTPGDLAIKARAEVILAAYRSRREAYIGPGKPGVVALLRDWFDDGYGWCDPAHARLSAPPPIVTENATPQTLTSTPSLTTIAPGSLHMSTTGAEFPSASPIQLSEGPSAPLGVHPSSFLPSFDGCVVYPIHRLFPTRKPFAWGWKGGKSWR